MGCQRCERDVLCVFSCSFLRRVVFQNPSGDDISLEKKTCAFCFQISETADMQDLASQTEEIWPSATEEVWRSEIFGFWTTAVEMNSQQWEI